MIYVAGIYCRSSHSWLFNNIHCCWFVYYQIYPPGQTQLMELCTSLYYEVLWAHYHFIRCVWINGQLTQSMDIISPFFLSFFTSYQIFLDSVRRKCKHIRERGGMPSESMVREKKYIYILLYPIYFHKNNKRISHLLLMVV